MNQSFQMLQQQQVHSPYGPPPQMNFLQPSGSFAGSQLSYYGPS